MRWLWDKGPKRSNCTAIQASEILPKASSRLAKAAGDGVCLKRFAAVDSELAALSKLAKYGKAIFCPKAPLKAA